MPEAFDDVFFAGAETRDGCEGGFEGVRFTGEVAFAFIFEGGDEAAADNVGCICEFDVG